MFNPRCRLGRPQQTLAFVQHIHQTSCAYVRGRRCWMIGWIRTLTNASELISRLGKHMGWKARTYELIVGINQDGPRRQCWG